MKKKLIVFRVIGHRKVGLGHVYRSLSLAKELKKKYSIIFITNLQSNLVPPVLKKFKYKLLSVNENKIIDKISSLDPKLVINDMLNTKVKDIKPLMKVGINVINFEDLGCGAKYANLVINELFDSPINKNKNTLWGYKYFFVRDEFKNCSPIKFRKKIRNVLITFGGTDHLSLSDKIYETIKLFCKKYNIKISIVTGPGYENFKELKKKVSSDRLSKVTHDTGVISKIMKSADLAITSNGRTVYELAHMNIPTIVISQHQRETTHLFANKSNGFVSLGKFKGKKTLKKVGAVMTELHENVTMRYKLFTRMKNFNFNNKIKIKNKIIDIINL